MISFYMKNYIFNRYTRKLIKKKKLTYKQAFILLNIFATSYPDAKNKTKYSCLDALTFSLELEISISHVRECLKHLVDSGLIKPHYYHKNKKWVLTKELKRKIPFKSLETRYEIIVTKTLEKMYKKHEEKTLES